MCEAVSFFCKSDNLSRVVLVGDVMLYLFHYHAYSKWIVLFPLIRGKTTICARFLYVIILVDVGFNHCTDDCICGLLAKGRWLFVHQLGHVQ